MGSLREAIAAEGGGKKGPLCTVRLFIDTLDADDRAALVEALASDAQTSQIWRAVRGFGFPSSQGTLQRHRKGDCGCGPG